MVLSFLAAGRAPVRTRAFRGLAYRDRPGRNLDVRAPLGADGEAPVVVVLATANLGLRRRPSALGRVLASRGLVVLSPLFDAKADLAGRLEDAALACAFARARAADYGGDPRRVFVVGEAEGACAAAMLALDPRWLGAAGAGGVLRGVVGVSGLYDLEPLEAHARAEAPPMLLIAETGPSGCSTARLAQTRRSAGRPVAEIRYPGQGSRLGLSGLAAVFGLSTTPLEQMERFIRLGSLEPAV